MAGDNWRTTWRDLPLHIDRDEAMRPVCGRTSSATPVSRIETEDGRTIRSTLGPACRESEQTRTTKVVTKGRFYQLQGLVS